MLFPLYPQHAMASQPLLWNLADEQVYRYFPEMKIATVPAFYNKPRFYKNLADSIKGHLEGYDYDHLPFSYHGIPNVTFVKQTLQKSHCKIDGSCCIHLQQLTNLLPTPKKQSKVAKLLACSADKYSQTFQSRLAGDKC
jgi:ferrochelatase